MQPDPGPELKGAPTGYVPLLESLQKHALGLIVALLIWKISCDGHNSESTIPLFEHNCPSHALLTQHCLIWAAIIQVSTVLVKFSPTVRVAG